MDSTVSIEVLVFRVTHPRQGMPICRNGCPRAGSNPRRGFMFNGSPKHCRARCATPHGVVGAAASPTATDREPPDGVRGCGRERLCPQPLLPWPAPSVTAVTRLPVPHRLHPPRLLHPHQADGQRGTGGGDDRCVGSLIINNLHSLKKNQKKRFNY